MGGPRDILGHSSVTRPGELICGFMKPIGLRWCWDVTEIQDTGGARHPTALTKCGWLYTLAGGGCFEAILTGASEVASIVLDLAIEAGLGVEPTKIATGPCCVVLTAEKNHRGHSAYLSLR